MGIDDALLSGVSIEVESLKDKGVVVLASLVLGLNVRGRFEEAEFPDRLQARP